MSSFVRRVVGDKLAALTLSDLLASSCLFHSICLTKRRVRWKPSALQRQLECSTRIIRLCSNQIIAKDTSFIAEIFKEPVARIILLIAFLRDSCSYFTCCCGSTSLSRNESPTPFKNDSVLLLFDLFIDHKHISFISLDEGRTDHFHNSNTYLLIHRNFTNP